MELTVRTRNTDATQAALKRIFRRHKFSYEVRQLDPPDEEEPVGCIVFYVSISVFVSTNQLNDEMLAVARGNIEGIEGEQQKSNSYIYQLGVREKCYDAQNACWSVRRGVNSTRHLPLLRLFGKSIRG